MANTTSRWMLVLAMLAACGGDDGGSGNEDGDDGDGDGDDGGSELTLAQALETAGTNVSQARVDLVFPAACEERVKCKPEPDCVENNQGTFESMASKRSAACRDVTLDLFSCFATTPCAEYDSDDTCNELGEKQEELCK